MLKKYLLALACMPMLASAQAPNPAAEARAALMKDYPALRQAITRGGAFGGGQFSAAIANNMYSRTHAQAIADARAMLRVEEQGPRTWLLHLPFVNIAVFDTDEGLVLVDSGYAPAGPALRETLKKLSDKPVHTIIHTHIHADHAWGAWALMDMGPAGKPPRIVATTEHVKELERDLRGHGFNAINNQQMTVPREWQDVIAPTLTFHDRLTLKIGADTFVLTHAPGETEDQLWVNVPSRKMVVSADYYQSQLTNFGNGRRRQRYAEEWAAALREMVAAKPERVLSMHGPAVIGTRDIEDKLLSAARLLESVDTQVLAGLNAGQRRDEVVEAVTVAPDLAQREDMRQVYVTFKDLGRMVAKQYSGWWDGLPSHWAPAPLPAEARELTELAGGPRRMMERALALLPTRPDLAGHLADWAWLAAPDDAVVLQGALDVYGRRSGPETTTQEALTYLEHITRLKLRLQTLKAAK